MPAFLLNAPSAGQQRLYLDESGTLGYGGEIFTMAMVLVRDLPKLEACTLKNRITQSEVKASQMKTAQKLALARTLLEENDIEIYLAKLDPLAAMISERKLDKELLYDSMVAQALAFYLERNELPQGLPYRISMDMRGGLRESYEDMVAESVGNVLMHRSEPLVTNLDARFLDSKYSAGIQAADLFSNIYRTALTQIDSPCRSFLRKYQTDGVVHAGFTFGLVELADQMTQIAADLRTRVELERAKAPVAEEILAPIIIEEMLAEKPAETEPASAAGLGTSRSARRRRSRASRRDREAGQALPQVEAVPSPDTAVPSPAIAMVAPEEPAPQPAEPEQPAAPTIPEPTAAPAPKPALPFAPEGRRTRTRRSRSTASATRRSDTESPVQAASAGAPAVPDSLEIAPITTASQPATSVPENPVDSAATPSPKPDVRPGRAVRSRQAAQVASRRRRRAQQQDAVTTAGPETPQAEIPAAEKPTQADPSPRKRRKTPSGTAAATPEVPSLPAPSEPEPVAPAQPESFSTPEAPVNPEPASVAPEASAPETPQAAPESAETPAKPAPRKRANSRRRSKANTPAAQETATSNEGATASETQPATEVPAKPAPRKRTNTRSRSKTASAAPEAPVES